MMLDWGEWGSFSHCTHDLFDGLVLKILATTMEKWVAEEMANLLLMPMF